MFYSLQKFRKGVRDTYALYADPFTKNYTRLREFIDSMLGAGKVPVLKVSSPDGRVIHGDFERLQLTGSILRSGGAVLEVYISEISHEDGRVAELDGRVFEVASENETSNKRGSK